jgi:hypothetical protein
VYLKRLKSYYARLSRRFCRALTSSEPTLEDFFDYFSFGTWLVSKTEIGRFVGVTFHPFRSNDLDEWRMYLLINDDAALRLRFTALSFVDICFLGVLNPISI